MKNFIARLIVVSIASVCIIGNISCSLSGETEAQKYNREKAESASSPVSGDKVNTVNGNAATGSSNSLTQTQCVAHYQKTGEMGPGCN